MGIFSSLFGRNTVKTPQVLPEEERKTTYMGGLTYNSITSFRNEQSMKLSAVYGATNIISNSVAMLTADVVRLSNGTKEVVDHPLNKILNYKPDNKYTAFQFWKMIVESVIIKGNAYALIERNSDLQVKSLRYVDSAFVQPTLQPDGTVKYIVDGLGKAVDSSDILHFFMHVDRTYRGVSLISFAYNCLKSSTDAEKHSENFFRSGANVNGILKMDQRLDQSQKEQIREAWRQTFTNSTNDSSGVVILPQGMDYQQLSLSPEDSQLIQCREFNITEISRFFNIPLSKLGVVSQSYNNLEMEQKIFIQDCIMPYLRMIEAQVNIKLFRPSELGKLKVQFDITQLMASDKKTEADYYKTLLVNGILSVNEVRTKLGYSPIEDGDNHIMQLSYTTLENITSGALIEGQSQQQPAQNQSNKIDNKVKKNG